MSLAAGQADGPPYAVVGTIADRVDGQMFRTFATDPMANRLYVGSDRGLFWVDLGEPLRIKGPVFRKDVRQIEFAPDIGRLFYYTYDEVGYVDVRTSSEPVRLAVGMKAHDIAYEPSRQELYVAGRAPYLLVFNAASGERAARIELPGWYGHGLEAAPGRVYMKVSPRPGLHVVDAASHRATPWPVSGRTEPTYVEVDPTGEYLFLAWDRTIAVVDTRTATVIGRVVTRRTASIAFDPGSRLLVATWEEDPPPLRVVAYRVDSKGLTELGRLKNPAVGQIGVEPTHRGFIQRGALSLIVWAFQGPRGS